MTEKISREELKKAKAADKAVDQILYLAKSRGEFAMNLGITGNVGRAQIESINSQMEEIAQANGLNLEEVLSAKEGQTSAVKKLEAERELSLMEKSYKDTQKAVKLSPDPYARMHLEGTLSGLETKMKDFAEKNGLSAKEVMQRRGKAELDSLAEERTMHELKVTLGDPASREKLYEFEHKARAIVEKYDLPAKHLEPFRVPEISPELEQRLKEVPLAEAAAVMKDIRITENAPKEKRGFFKRIFGSKEARGQKKDDALQRQTFEAIGAAKVKYADLTKLLAQSDPNSPLYPQLEEVLRNIEKGAAETIARYKGPLSAHDLGPFANLVTESEKPASAGGEGKDERFTPSISESRYGKFKNKIKKYFTIGLFTVSAVSKPLPTADVNPIKQDEGKKIEALSKAPTAATALPGKTDENVFSRTQEKIEREKTPRQVTHKETVTAPVDTAASNAEKIEQLKTLGLRTLKVETPQPSMMERIRAIDTAERQKPDVQYTGEAPVYAPLPTSPVPPGGLLPESPIPQAQGLYSPRTHIETPDTAKGGGGIKVSYEDENGAPLNVDSLAKGQERVAQKTPEIKDTTQAVRENLPQAKEIAKQIFEGYKKNLLGRDFSNPNSYDKALHTIVTMYQLNKIAGPQYMTPKIVTPETNITQKNVDAAQGVFRTVGGETVGTGNTVEVLTSTLNYAGNSQEQFNQIVMSMFHEYVHAWQKSSAGIEDHVEREAQAHYFTLFPGQFSQWRQAHYHPDGDVSKTYPEMNVSFPELDEQHKLMYASDFEDYYAKLSPSKQAEYKDMQATVMQLLNVLGIQKYYEHQAITDYFKGFPEQLPEWRKTQLGLETEEGAFTTKASPEVQAEMAAKFEGIYAKMTKEGQEKFSDMHERMLSVLGGTAAVSETPAATEATAPAALPSRETIARVPTIPVKRFAPSRRTPGTVSRRRDVPAVSTPAPVRQEAAPLTPPSAPADAAPIRPNERYDTTTFDRNEPEAPTR